MLGRYSGSYMVLRTLFVCDRRSRAAGVHFVAAQRRRNQSPCVNK